MPGSAPAPLELRDPAFIERALPVLEPFFQRYHQLSVSGLEHLPVGPALAVGNHNGGIMSPDMFGLMVAFWRHRGVTEPAYGLMHDLAWNLPGIGPVMAKLGALPASHDNGLRALARGAKVLVYPGGDLDAFKPWHRRHEVIFGERRGFVRLALRAGVPIVPVVSIGAHEAMHVLTDGVELARRFRLKERLRLEAVPVALGLPFGLILGPMGYLPLPVRMHIRVLPSMSWPDRSGDDDADVARCRDEVRGAMQEAMNELAATGDYGRLWPRRANGKRP